MTIEEAIYTGFEFYTEENFNESIRYFEAIINVDPKHAKALLGLGLSKVRLGGGDNFEFGLAAIRKSIFYDDTDPVSQYYYGRIQFDEENYEDAKISLVRSCILQPEENMSSYYLCELGFAIGDHELIADYIDDALALSVLDHVSMACNLATYLAVLGREQEAFRQYQLALEIDQTYYPLLYNIGIAYQKAGDYMNGEIKFREVLKYVEDYGEVYNYLLDALLENRKWEDAILYAKKAIELHPDNPEYLFKLALNYNENGQHEEAIETYSLYFTKSPGDSNAWNCYGIALADSGNNDLAVRAYEYSLSLESDNVKALNNLGHLYANMNDFVRAESYLKKAIKIAPDYVVGYSSLHDIYQMQGKMQPAMIQLEKVLEIDPSKPKVALMLITYYFHAGYEKDYLALYRDALANNPTDENLYFSYVNYLDFIGYDYQQRMEIIENAIALIPENKLLYALSAMTLRDAGERNEAIVYLNKILKIHPLDEQCNVMLGSLMESEDAELAKSYYQKILRNKPDSYLALSALAGHEYYHEREESAYELAIRVITLQPLWFEGYRLLSNINRAVNPDRDKHFFTFLYYGNKMSAGLNFEKLRYSINLESPMLIYHLAQQISNFETVEFEGPVQEAYEIVKVFNRYFAVWGNESDVAYFAEALCNFHLGDPLAAFLIFAFNIKDEFYIGNPMAAYYYALSAHTTGINEGAVKSFSLSCTKDYNFDNLTKRYYQALIQELNSNYLEAMRLLDQIWEQYRPAAYQLSILTKKYNLPDEDFAFRLAIKEELNPVYSYGCEPVKMAEDPAEFLINILPVLHFIEVEEILGLFFKTELDVQAPFARLIIADALDLGKNQLSLKKKLSVIWGKLVEKRIAIADRQDLVNRMSASSYPALVLAKDLYRQATAELFLVKDNYRVHEGFEFRLYLQVIFDLYEREQLSLEQAVDLTSYLQYCLNHIPYKREDKKLTFIVDTCLELLWDASGIPDTYWLDKFLELKEILEEEKTTKDAPLKTFKEFVQIRQG